MPSIRATTDQVIDRVRTSFRSAAMTYAGGNHLLSKQERSAMAPGILKATSQGLTGLVTVAAATDAATAFVEAELGKVNQASGVGSRYVSSAEVRVLAKAHAEAGRRVASAWEDVTGQALTIPGGTPSPSTGNVGAVLAASTNGPLQLKVDEGRLNLKVVGGSLDPTALTVELKGRKVVVTLPPHPTARVTVEALRAAAPDLDLAVLTGSAKEMTVRYYPKGASPTPESGSIYAHFVQAPKPAHPGSDLFVRRVHGMKSFELMPSMWTADGVVELLVDSRRFLVKPGTKVKNGWDAVYELKRQVLAAGLPLEFNDWHQAGGVAKFKLL